MERVLVADAGFPEHPGLDIAVSHAVLLAVARGELGSVFRLHTPSRVLAFGMADRIGPNYIHATRIAGAHGFAAVQRLAGGRAAVFHQRTLAFSWATKEDDPRAGITERFRRVSGLMRDALRSLDVDARVGLVPGEYCPGEYSVNIGGTAKVVGLGQRLVRGASHVGGVIVVDDSASIRDVLIPVYRALGIDWDPRTTGAVADHAAGIGPEAVSTAVLNRLADNIEVVKGSIPEEIVAQGRHLLDSHLPQAA